jgi:DNA polymerase type B, organellar and viral
MYIPTNPIGKKIYGYDVNSLYASVMINNPYPVGNPTYFEGNILVDNATENRAFGFFYCKITAPDDLLHPILQIHHNNRTVSPLGTWEGMYFSEELYNAEKYGYKFEIL